MIETHSADPGQDNVGKEVRVCQLVCDAYERGYTAVARAYARVGQTGKVCGYHNSHGLCYDVQHLDGTKATYEPEELELLPTHATQLMSQLSDAALATIPFVDQEQLLSSGERASERAVRDSKMGWNASFHFIIRREGNNRYRVLKDKDKAPVVYLSASALVRRLDELPDETEILWLREEPSP